VSRFSGIRRSLTWVALIGSVTLAAVFTLIRATDPSDGARISFYGDSWSTAGIVIAPIDQPAPGLQDGDLVTAVGGRSMESWLTDSTSRDVARPTSAAPIPYAIVRDGAPLAIDVQWSAPSIWATLLAGWSIVAF